MKIIRTNAKHTDFIKLVSLLDADLAVRDGEDHDFYHQFNQIDSIKEAVVLYKNDLAIGCGAIKSFDERTAEIKRMYVLNEERGQGYASKILDELEKWAKEKGYQRCILETGFKQPEAIRLYEKYGFHRIKNYGQYEGIENSLCFEKFMR